MESFSRKAGRTGVSTALELKELNAEKRSVKVGHIGSTFPACYFNNVTQLIFQGCYNLQCYYSIRVSHVCELG